MRNKITKNTQSLNKTYCFKLTNYLLFFCFLNYQITTAQTTSISESNFEKTSIDLKHNTTPSFGIASVSNINFGTIYTGRLYEETNKACIGSSITSEVSISSVTTCIQPSQNGSTLATLSTLIYANSVLGATSYRFEVTNGTNTRRIEQTSRALKLTSLSGGALYETIYFIKVAVKINDIWTDFGTESSVSTPVLPFTKIQNSQCGSVLPAINTVLFCDAILGATKYRFEVTNGPSTNTVETTSRCFSLTAIPNIKYETDYFVRTAILYNGVWQDFGTSCEITTPLLPFTKIINSQCGSVLPAINTALFCDAILGATKYRFEVTNGSSTNTVETTSRCFSLTAIPNIKYETIYFVRTAILYNGVWQDFGTSCEITTPILPFTKIQNSQCGILLPAINTVLFCDAILGTTKYQFEVTNGDVTQTYITDSRVFRLTSLEKIDYNQTYTIKVAILYKGVWQNFGMPCQVTTPILISRDTVLEKELIVANANTPFNAKSNKNPFETNFEIILENTKVSTTFIRVFDITGKEIEIREVSSIKEEPILFGDHYPSGVYHLIISNGSIAKRLQMIKK